MVNTPTPTVLPAAISSVGLVHAHYQGELPIVVLLCAFFVCHSPPSAPLFPTSRDTQNYPIRKGRALIIDFLSSEGRNDLLHERLLWHPRLPGHVNFCPWLAYINLLILPPLEKSLSLFLFFFSLLSSSRHRTRIHRARNSYRLLSVFIISSLPRLSDRFRPLTCHFLRLLDSTLVSGHFFSLEAGFGSSRFLFPFSLAASSLDVKRSTTVLFPSSSSSFYRHPFSFFFPPSAPLLAASSTGCSPWVSTLHRAPFPIVSDVVFCQEKRQQRPICPSPLSDSSPTSSSPIQSGPS
jgi:hypothetical protein